MGRGRGSSNRPPRDLRDVVDEILRKPIDDLRPRPDPRDEELRRIIESGK